MSVLEVVLLILLGIGTATYITILSIKTFRKKKTKKEEINQEETEE